MSAHIATSKSSQTSNEIRFLIKEALYLSKEDNLQISLFKLRNNCEEYFRYFSTTTTITAVLSKCLLNLEKEALVLWNIIAANSDKYSKECIAAVNYVISRILMQISNPIKDLSAKKKLILIKITTGTCRSLLDCCQIERAEEISRDCVVIFDLFDGISPEFGAELMKFEFFNEISRVEIDVRNGKDEEGLVHVEKCKCLLGKLEKSCRIYLINFCYNLGLEFYYEKMFEKSSVWLRNAFQIGLDCKGGVSVEFNSCLILNLLADVYLHWNEHEHWDKALHVLQLSEKYGECDRFLRVRAVVCGKMTGSDILSAFYQWIVGKPSDSDAFRVIELLIKCDAFENVSTVLVELEKKLSRANDAGKFIHFFLSNLHTETHFEDAVTIFTEFQKKNEINLCAIMAAAISDLCIQKGQKFHRSFDYQKSIFWYNLSEFYLTSFTKDEKNRLLCTLRCKCLCFVEKPEIGNALVELEKIKYRLNGVESKNPIDFFLNFQVAILSGDENLALETINKLDFIDDKVLCCSIKRCINDDKNQQFILVLLEKLLETTQNDALFILATKIAIRIRLLNTQLTDGDFSWFFTHLDAAYQRLLNGKCAKIQLELEWFSKICWNLALGQSNHPECVFNSFLNCYKFLSISTCKDESYLMRKLMTLLLCCAAGLEIAANNKDKEEKRNFCLKITNLIEQGETLLSEFVTRNLVQNVKFESMKTSVLLYKFETCIHLNHPSTSGILDEILSMKNIDTQSLTKLAAISMEFGENFATLKIRILIVLISKLKSEPVKLDEISNFYRCLISEFLNNNLKNDPEFLNCVESAVQFVLSQENYPEIEVLWLMVSIWNIGVSYLLEDQLPIARKWCILASNLLPKLPTIGTNYKQKIQFLIESQNWN